MARVTIFLDTLDARLTDGQVAHVNARLDELASFDELKPTRLRKLKRRLARCVPELGDGRGRAVLECAAAVCGVFALVHGM